MTSSRDASGRFAPKPRDELSPAYRQRVERADAQGKSRKQARGHGTTPRRAWEIASVYGTERYDRALQVVNRVRHGESLSRAAKEVGISPDTVRRYAGRAFVQDDRGRWQAKPSDRLYRRMRWLDARGMTTVEPANSKEASKLSAYWKAVEHYLTTGDERALRKFRRMRLRTRQKISLGFITDPDLLDRLGSAGELAFEDLYEH